MKHPFIKWLLLCIVTLFVSELFKNAINFDRLFHSSFSEQFTSKQIENNKCSSFNTQLLLSITYMRFSIFKFLIAVIASIYLAYYYYTNQNSDSSTLKMAGVLCLGIAIVIALINKSKKSRNNDNKN
ncbi:hypothetical protein [Flavobacterium crocinum]|nr:hypothetical protein [Flavobacterium crocinum]